MSSNRFSNTIGAVVILGAFLWAHSNRKRRATPPGPPPKPIIGNLLDLPQEYEYVKYREWSEEYNSDIIQLKVMGTNLIILNSLEVAIDVLENRSATYSSRVHMTMLMDLMGWSWGFGFAPYGEYWRAHRRLFHKEFHGAAIKNHYPAITRSTYGLLTRLIDNPEGFLEHIRYQVGATIVDVAYGIKAKPTNDPILRNAEEATTTFSKAAMPGAFLVDTLPFLKYVPEWVPGAGFQKKAREWKKFGEAVVNEPFEILRKSFEAGNARPSFALRCFQDMDSHGDLEYQERIIKNTAATMYIAGADTTVSVIETFILAMVLYPEIQKRAQAELDIAIGPGHLPTFDDEASLPFLSAIVKEVLRWQVVTPIGFPHMSTEDDVYRGYFIPKGSVIVSNIWAILHDEKVYPDPYTFNPDRYMKDGQLDFSVQDPELACFGFGRRICPGRPMGRSSLWLAAGCLLATFNLEKAIGPDGLPITPNGKYISGALSHAEPFQCKITPRSKEMVDVVKAAANAME